MEFKLPDIGEGTVEAEVVKWLVREGDEVAEDQPILEVMTDKANVEIPSPVAGVIESLPWKVGDVVPVGDTLVVIAEGARAGSAPQQAASVPLQAAPAPAPVAASGPQASWNLPIPNTALLAGGRFFLQAFVLDPGANPFGATVTNAVEAIVR